MKILCAIAAVLILLLPAGAATLRTGDQILIARGQVIDDDLVALGSKVTIEGTVKGDVFAFAGDILIKGRIEGEVIPCGGNITIDDTVTGPVRAFGGNIAHNGFIKGNFWAFGGRIGVKGGCGRDATIKGGDVDISGAIARDLGVESKTLRISGAVGRDAHLRCRVLSFATPLAVGRNLFYQTPAKIALPAGAAVGGTTAWDQLIVKKHGLRHGLRSLRMILRWLSFLSMLAIGLALIAVSRRQCLAVTGTVDADFWKSFGLGVLWLVALPIAAAILLVTLIGIPLAAFAVFAYAAVLYLAHIFFSLLLGQKVFRLLKRPDISPYLAYIVGLAIVSALLMVPFLGFLLGLFLLLIGSGAIILSRARLMASLRAGGAI